MDVVRGEHPGNERMGQQGPPLGATQQGPWGQEHAQPSRALMRGSAVRSGRAPQGAQPVPQGVHTRVGGCYGQSCELQNRGHLRKFTGTWFCRQKACRLFCLGKTIPGCCAPAAGQLSYLPSRDPLYGPPMTCSRFRHPGSLVALASKPQSRALGSLPLKHHQAAAFSLEDCPLQVPAHVMQTRGGGGTSISPRWGLWACSAAGGHAWGMGGDRLSKEGPCDPGGQGLARAVASAKQSARGRELLQPYVGNSVAMSKCLFFFLQTLHKILLF